MSNKFHIIETALARAEREGVKGIVATKLSEQCGVPHSLIFYYFGSMENLRDEVVKTALERGTLKVIGKALSDGHDLVQDLPQDRKIEALNSLI